MSQQPEIDLHGRCACGESGYQLMDSPLFTHCCHCTWCQRETGSAFAVNALIETSKIRLDGAELEKRELPTNSGGGQTIVGCRSCKTVLWSHYSSAQEAIAFVRTGTLVDGHCIFPDLHIFLQSKLEWVQVPSEHFGVAKYYRQGDYWPADCITRYQKALESHSAKSTLVWS